MWRLSGYLKRLTGLRRQVWAGLLVWLSVWVALPAWADALLAPGRHQDVLAWTAPWQPDVPAPPPHQQVRLTGIAIGAADLRFKLESGRESAVLVAVLRPVPLATGGPFDWRHEPQVASPPLAAARHALQAHLQAGNTPTLRQRLVLEDPANNALQPGKTPSSARAVASTALGLAGALWLVWALLLAALLVRARHLQWLGLAGVFALALAVRLHQPMTVLHVNGHLVQDLAAALLPGQPEVLLELVDLYGPTWIWPQRLVAHLGSGDWQWLPYLHAAAGALAALLVMVAAGGRGLAAVVAGLGFALWPLASHMTASESPAVFGQLALAAVLAATSPLGLATTTPRLHSIASASRPAQLPALLAVASLLLLGWGHMFGAGLAGAVWLMVAPWLWSRTQRRLLVALAAVPLVAAAWTFGADGSANRSRLATHSAQLPNMLPAWEHSLWLDPDWMPLWLLVLALAGLVVWWAKGLPPGHRWWGLLAGLGLLVLHEVTCFTSASVAVALRYQPVLAPVLALGLAGVVGLAGSWRGKAALAAIVVGLSALAAASPPARSWQDMEGLEFQWLATQAQQIPDGAVVVVPDTFSSPTSEVSGGILSGFVAVLAQPLSRHWEVVTEDSWRQARRQGRYTSQPTWVWRSVACQAFQRAVPKPAHWKRLPDGTEVAPGCYDLLLQAGAPLFVTRWPNPGPDRPHKVADHFHHYHGADIRAGLYRLDNDKAP